MNQIIQTVNKSVKLFFQPLHYFVILVLMYLIFDTETTGLPKRWDLPLTESENWPRCIQIAWQIHDSNGAIVSHKDYLIKPDNFTIPFDSEKIHGISTALASQEGVP